MGRAEPGRSRADAKLEWLHGDFRTRSLLCDHAIGNILDRTVVNQK
jgi:hypothetical protein